MTSTDSNNGDSGPCCECDPCCSSSEKKSGMSRGWKTGIFVIVVLLAMGVSAYSLFIRDPGGSASSCGPCPPGESSAICGEPTGIKDLDEKTTGFDFIIILLPGPAAELPEDMVQATAAAISQIKTKQVKAKSLILDSDNPTFALFVKQFKISEFPAAVTMSQGGHQVLTKSAIAEKSLLDAYQKAAAQSAACCPAGT